MPADGKMCKANSPVRALGLHRELRRVHLRLLGRLPASLPVTLLPSPGHVPHLLLDQTPLSLCKLLSRVLEPHCPACESFCFPISASLPATTECWVSRTNLSGGTGSRSEPPSGCCPLHHSTMHSIIWNTSIVWTSCKYSSKKPFSPTG